MRAVIFAGAEITNYVFCKKYIAEECIVICCDSGMRHAKKLKITPDVIVGDFDSVDDETFSFFKQKNIEILEYPTHKDETDMELGLDWALEKGADDITIIGGIGSRMDHTMANCHYLLYLLKKGVNARIVNQDNEIILIDHECTLHGAKGDLVSTIPLSMSVSGITTEGLEYPLKNATLTIDDRLIAVSNVMTDTIAKISITEGYLYVMKCID